MELPRPKRYKNKWLIWSETVLDILDVSDCDDTISGVCLYNKTLEECIDECVKDCGAGYHIDF